LNAFPEHILGKITTPLGAVFEKEMINAIVSYFSNAASVREYRFDTSNSHFLTKKVPLYYATCIYRF